MTVLQHVRHKHATVYCLTIQDDACPLFMRQRLGLPHELAHRVNPRVGVNYNVALLSLMRRV